MTDIALAIPSKFTFRRRRTGFCGVGSFLLLAAALKWAHHWGLRADLIVAAWGVTTAIAFIGGLRLYMDFDSDGLGRFAKIGFAFAAMSVGALIVAGIAAAAGTSPPGCGGG